MEDLKGILALLTACLSLCIVINFLLFYKDRKVIFDALIPAGMLFINQLAEFVTSFWQINNPIITFVYIATFNFAISFSTYYLLKVIQPESKHNWKAFMLSIMMLPAGFVYMSTFKMVSPGFFFTEYRYFASPMANFTIGLLQAFLGIFFLSKFLFSNSDLRKIAHYRFLLFGYIIPPLVFIFAALASLSSILVFESLFSKLLILNIMSLLYFIIKTRK